MHRERLERYRSGATHYGTQRDRDCELDAARAGTGAPEGATGSRPRAELQN